MAGESTASPERASAAPGESHRLFDARYRWVLLHALKWLRSVPDIDLDLDEPAQLQTAYDCMRAFVLRYVLEHDLCDDLDPMSVAAIAESAPARATVESLLRSEHPGAEDAETRKLIDDAVHAPDPSLEPAAIDRRARDRRLEFAKSFGLHARITDVEVSGSGLRVHVAFDEDIAFTPDDLKTLEINGVLLAGAQLVDVHRNEAGSPRVEAVLVANVDRASIETLRSLPMRVTATTKDDVHMQAMKMA
ncbi:MAG: hypothetical protein R3B70_47660 [Polyangiaceae bacterium]